MANYVPLHNETHRNIRIITSRGADYGENIHFVPVVADELRSVVLDYPVFLIKDPDTGQFGLNALLGFEPGENLFLEDDRWNAVYVPAHVRRQPFMVGVQGKPGDEKTPQNTFITINTDSPRVSEEEGERLFDDEGMATPYLENTSRMVFGLMNGVENSKIFIDWLAEKDLIESAQLNVTFGSGEQKRFDGLYTVNDEKMAELDSEIVQGMYKTGYLQACELITASTGQMQRLIDLKNEKAAGG